MQYLKFSRAYLLSASRGPASYRVHIEFSGEHAADVSNYRS